MGQGREMRHGFTVNIGTDFRQFFNVESFEGGWEFVALNSVKVLGSASLQDF